MGPRALAASSGLAPWSMAVDRDPVATLEIPIENGGQEVVLLGYFLPEGEWESPSQFPPAL